MGGKLTVARKLGLGAASQVSLFLVFDVTRTVLLCVFVSAETVFVTGMKQSSMGLLECLSGPTKIELASIGYLGKLGCPLLSLVKVVVSSLESIVAFRVLSLLKAVQTSELVDVLLVTVALLLKLAQLEVGIVKLLLESVASI